METSITSMKKTEDPIVIEQLYDASLDEVWTAITERDQMIQWFFNNIPAFDSRVGFETKFNVNSGGRYFLHLWKLTDVVPRERITYQWSYEGYKGESWVTFELFEQNDKAGITLTFKVVENFLDGIPEFTRKSGEQGWSYFIQSSLKDYLNS